MSSIYLPQKIKQYVNFRGVHSDLSELKTYSQKTLFDFWDIFWYPKYTWNLSGEWRKISCPPLGYIWGLPANFNSSWGARADCSCCSGVFGQPAKQLRRDTLTTCSAGAFLGCYTELPRQQEKFFLQDELLEGCLNWTTLQSPSPAVTRIILVRSAPRRAILVSWI